MTTQVDTNPANNERIEDFRDAFFALIEGNDADYNELADDFNTLADQYQALEAESDLMHEALHNLGLCDTVHDEIEAIEAANAASPYDVFPDPVEDFFGQLAGLPGIVLYVSDGNGELTAFGGAPEGDLDLLSSFFAGVLDGPR